MAIGEAGRIQGDGNEDGGGKNPRHKEFAVSEIDHEQHAVHQRVTQRDQRVEAALSQTKN